MIRKIVIAGFCLYASCFAPTASEDKALCRSLWIANKENIVSFIAENKKVPIYYCFSRTKSDRYLIHLEYDSIDNKKVIRDKWINIKKNNDTIRKLTNCNITSFNIYKGINWFHLHDMPENITMYYIPTNKVDSILEYRKDIFTKKHLWISDSIFIVYDR